MHFGLNCQRSTISLRLSYAHFSDLVWWHVVLPHVSQELSLHVVVLHS